MYRLLMQTLVDSVLSVEFFENGHVGMKQLEILSLEQKKTSLIQQTVDTFNILKFFYIR